MISLREPYPDAQVLHVGISPYTRVQKQIPTYLQNLWAVKKFLMESAVFNT